MDVGNKQIPEFRLSTTLLQDIKKLYEKFSTKEISFDQAAEALEHKSPKSGTFLRKIAAMRAYGIADGRGNIRVTDLGQKLSSPTIDENTRNDAMIQAINNIPLWHILYEKYTKTNTPIPNDFYITDLTQHCDLTIEEARKIAPEILKDFKDDTKFIMMSSTLQSAPSGNPQNPRSGGSNSPHPDEDVLEITYGKYGLRLPKDEAEKEEVGEILKGMIDLALGKKKKIE